MDRRRKKYQPKKQRKSIALSNDSISSLTRDDAADGDADGGGGGGGGTSSSFDIAAELQRSQSIELLKERFYKSGKKMDEANFVRSLKATLSPQSLSGVADDQLAHLFRLIDVRKEGVVTWDDFTSYCVDAAILNKISREIAENLVQWDLNSDVFTVNAHRPWKLKTMCGPEHTRDMLVIDASSAVFVIQCGAGECDDSNDDDDDNNATDILGGNAGSTSPSSSTSSPSKNKSKKKHNKKKHKDSSSSSNPNAKTFNDFRSMRSQRINFYMEGITIDAEYVPTEDVYAIATAGSDIGVFDAEMNALETVRVEASIQYLCWNDAAKVLVSGDRSGNVACWVIERTPTERLLPPTLVRTWFLANSPVVYITCHSTSGSIVVGFLDGTICVMHFPTGRIERRFNASIDGSSLTCLSVSEHQNAIITGCGSVLPMLWTLTACDDSKPFALDDRNNPHLGPIVSVIAIPDSAQGITLDFTGIAKVWDLRTFSCLQTFQLRMRDIKVCWHSLALNGARDAIFCCDRKNLSILSQVDEVEEHTSKGAVTAIAFSALTSRVLSTNLSGLCLWDLRRGFLFGEIPNITETKREITCSCIDDDGNRYFLGTTKGAVYVLNASTAGVVSCFPRAHKADVCTMCYMSHANMAVSCAVDGSGSLLMPPQLGHVGDVMGLRVQTGFRGMTGRVCSYIGSPSFFVVAADASGNLNFFDCRHVRVTCHIVNTFTVTLTPPPRNLFVHAESAGFYSGVQTAASVASLRALKRSSASTVGLEMNVATTSFIPITSLTVPASSSSSPSKLVGSGSGWCFVSDVFTVSVLFSHACPKEDPDSKPELTNHVAMRWCLDKELREDGNGIGQMAWSEALKRLYVADDAGRIICFDVGEIVDTIARASVANGTASPDNIQCLGSLDGPMITAAINLETVITCLITTAPTSQLNAPRIVAGAGTGVVYVLTPDLSVLWCTLEKVRSPDVHTEAQIQQLAAAAAGEGSQDGDDEQQDGKKGKKKKKKKDHELLGERAVKIPIRFKNGRRATRKSVSVRDIAVMDVENFGEYVTEESPLGASQQHSQIRSKKLKSSHHHDQEWVQKQLETLCSGFSCYAKHDHSKDDNVAFYTPNLKIPVAFSPDPFAEFTLVGGDDNAARKQRLEEAQNQREEESDTSGEEEQNQRTRKIPKVHIPKYAYLKRYIMEKTLPFPPVCRERTDNLPGELRERLQREQELEQVRVALAAESSGAARARIPSSSNNKSRGKTPTLVRPPISALRSMNPLDLCSASKSMLMSSASSSSPSNLSSSHSPTQRNNLRSTPSVGMTTATASATSSSPQGMHVSSLQAHILHHSSAATRMKGSTPLSGTVAESSLNSTVNTTLAGSRVAQPQQQQQQQRRRVQQLPSMRAPDPELPSWMC